MRTLIVYATKYGCTEKCAIMLAQKLNGDVDLCNLGRTKEPDLSQYDNVIVGGSVYIGKVRKPARQFCARHMAELLTKRLGLYICCMREGDIAETELITSFNSELLDHATAADYFGGEFQFKRMNWLDKWIAQKAADVDTDTSMLHLDHIEKFAERMNTAMSS